MAETEFTLLAVGEEVPYVMQQVGHVDPKVTLGIYAQVMFRRDGEREQLREAHRHGLVPGAHISTLQQGIGLFKPIATMGAAGFEPATSRVLKRRS